jgi:hypothetical protein
VHDFTSFIGLLKLFFVIDVVYKIVLFNKKLSIDFYYFSLKKK